MSDVSKPFSTPATKGDVAMVAIHLAGAVIEINDTISALKGNDPMLVIEGQKKINDTVNRIHQLFDELMGGIT